MKEIDFKKYNSIEDFNKDTYSLLKIINNDTSKMSISEKIFYVRKQIDKSILNSYLFVGHISLDIKELLNSNCSKLKFSMDNMIKNRLAHPEVMDADYAKIPLIIKNPSKYLKSKNGYDVILFKKDKKCYKLVIKTTKNKEENFIKSLHLLNEGRYNKY